MFCFNFCVFENKTPNFKPEQTEPYLPLSVVVIVFNTLLYSIVSTWSFCSVEEKLCSIAFNYYTLPSLIVAVDLIARVGWCNRYIVDNVW